jgi:N utilization substance protein A
MMPLKSISEVTKFMAKSELMAALEQIAREKNIPVEEILSMIEGAVVSSLRKHVGKNADIRARIDRDSGQFSAMVAKKVVGTVVDPEMEIGVDQAQKYKKGAVVGDEVTYPAPAADFARIAAQTAKQVLTQRVREVERDKLYDEFKPKEGEIVNGSVHRFLDRNIIVDLGKTEGILPLREQIRRERYGIGASLRAVILRVDKVQRGPVVVLSRVSGVGGCRGRMATASRFCRQAVPVLFEGVRLCDGVRWADHESDA